MSMVDMWGISRRSKKHAQEKLLIAKQSQVSSYILYLIERVKCNERLASDKKSRKDYKEEGQRKEHDKRENPCNYNRRNY